PHGRVLVEDVAQSLGMSERTLARNLSDEGLNFTEILQQLRRNLAVRYLDDRKLHVSKIAWLLGFHEVSAFTACLQALDWQDTARDANSRRLLTAPDEQHGALDGLVFLGSALDGANVTIQSPRLLRGLT